MPFIVDPLSFQCNNTFVKPVYSFYSFILCHSPPLIGRDKIYFLKYVLGQFWALNFPLTK